MQRHVPSAYQMKAVIPAHMAEVLNSRQIPRNPVDVLGSGLAACVCADIRSPPAGRNAGLTRLHDGGSLGRLALGRFQPVSNLSPFFLDISTAGKRGP